jgi:hypothetical protein
MLEDSTTTNYFPSSKESCVYLSKLMALQFKKFEIEIYLISPFLLLCKREASLLVPPIWHKDEGGRNAPASTK